MYMNNNLLTVFHCSFSVIGVGVGMGLGVGLGVGGWGCVISLARGATLVLRGFRPLQLPSGTLL
jgi:hypothetical protein